MPAHTSRVPALALWTVWKFWPEFCIRANFPNSFRLGPTIRASSGSANESSVVAAVRCKVVGIAGDTLATTACLLGAFRRGFGLMLRPDGHDRQSDQDSNRDFEEAVKRNDPCSV